ncbi:MAG: hypothetical protein Q9194_007780, partial [Teloschistes cf. exilis]
MAPNRNSEEDYVPKLKGVSNYETWVKQMSDVLCSAKLWPYVTGTSKRPIEIQADSGEQSKEDRIFQYTLRRHIDEWDDNAEACVGRILKATTVIVQNDCDAKLATYPDKESWDPPTLWEYLKARYTERGWMTKWSLIN